MNIAAPLLPGSGIRKNSPANERLFRHGGEALTMCVVYQPQIFAETEFNGMHGHVPRLPRRRDRSKKYWAGCQEAYRQL